MREDEVRRLQSALKALQRRQRRERVPIAGLSLTSLRVVGVVARATSGCGPGRIADELQMTTSNVAAALRQLEAAGFVTRRQDHEDTRRVTVDLTEAGASMVAESRDARDAWLSEAIDAVLDDDEQRLLLDAGRLLARVADFDGDTGASNR